MRLLPVLLLVIMLLLAGCGQKGPLFLLGHGPATTADQFAVDASSSDDGSVADEGPAAPGKAGTRQAQ